MSSYRGRRQSNYGGRTFKRSLQPTRATHARSNELRLVGGRWAINGQQSTLESHVEAAKVRALDTFEKPEQAKSLDLEKLATEVPDVNNPNKINYWTEREGYMIYLEGWCDKCFAGTGIGKYETQKKLTTQKT
jgi:hypothetical protein